jgi:hypothetical protein
MIGWGQVDSSIDENRIPKVFQLLGFGLAQEMQSKVQYCPLQI